MWLNRLLAAWLAKNVNISAEDPSTVDGFPKSRKSSPMLTRSEQGCLLFLAA
jgi:hypothetical protein